MPSGSLGFSNQFQKPLGYQQFTSLGSAIQLGVTAPSTGPTAIPAKATMCVISVEGAAIRWRDDGTPPTASIGMPVGNGQSLSYSGDMTALQMIQQAASATVNITYYA